MNSTYPSNWETGTLGSCVLECNSGASLSPSDFQKSGMLVIPKKSVQRGGVVVFDDDREYCSHEYASVNSKSIVNSEYVITSLRDLVPSGPSIGLIGELKGSGNFLLAQGVYGLRLKSKLDKQYLSHLSNQDWYRREMRQLMVGSTQVHIRIGEFLESTIPIPPLPEQKKIAEILSGIDTQRQALAKKAATASMLRNALGEKIFSSLDGERVALGELCNPKQWQTISANQLTTSGYPVYGANGKIGYFTEYNHKEPVLAVTCRGATCGNLTLIPAFSYVTGNSMCLDNPRKDTSPEYLFQFLAWRGLRDVISGSAQPQITRSPLQAVEVVLPSKEKQDKIVSALQSVNNTEQLVNIALSRLDILKKAIAADLLSGRKRVSV